MWHDKAMRGALVLFLALPSAFAAYPPTTFTFNAGESCTGLCFGGIQIQAATIDAAGNTYLTGNTNLKTLPVTPNAFQSSLVPSSCPGTPFLTLPCNDAFIVKLDPSGNVIYATYLGGSGDDYGYAIAVDPQGNIYVAGVTTYNLGATVTFPVTPGAWFTSPSQTAAFLAKLNPAGELVYSTFLPAYWVSGTPPIAMTVDANGNAYVALTVNPATGFLTTTGAFQAAAPANITGSQIVPVIAKVNAAGSALVYATYLCGSGQMGLAEAAVGGIAVDSAGDVFVAGRTSSADFPVTPGAFQPKNPNPAPGTTGFVTELNPEGPGLIYSTYLGGGASDQALAIKVDAQGGATVLGQTNSPGFPTTETLWSFSSGGGFIAHLRPGGTSLTYSTFLPMASGLDLDVAGNAYVAGIPGNAGDAYVWRISASGQLTGSEDLGANSASIVAVAPNGSVVLCGIDYLAGFPGITPGPATKTGLAFATSFFISATFMNAASYQGGIVAPGELVAIRGHGFPLAIGESKSPGATGKLPTNFEGVTVMFDEFAAPLLYVQSQQINAQVPWEIAGRSSVQVSLHVQPNPFAQVIELLGPYPLAVVASQHGVFYVNNADGSRNSPANPAQAGDFIAIYGTGGGPVNPAGVTGGFWPLTLPPPALTLPASVTIGGETATVVYAGAPPLSSSGIFQINTIVPANLPVPAASSLVVTIGGVSSPASAFTIAIKQ
jgi:uncharacterized protein (TIGR03437 family)